MIDAAVIANQDSSLKIDFPSRVVSTNVKAIKDSIFEKLPEAQNIDFDMCLLTFEETVMIDSLGLNLIVSLIEWCETNKLSMEANIKYDVIETTFTNVWLDQKIKINRL